MDYFYTKISDLNKITLTECQIHALLDSEQDGFTDKVNSKWK